MKNIWLLAALVLSIHANADLLTLKPTNPPTSNTGVALSSGGSASLSGFNFPVTTVGQALRVKNGSKVYVGQLMVSDTSRYVKTVAGALSSLDNEQSVALVMNFIMFVPTFMVTSDFKAAAQLNNVVATDPDIAPFMDFVSLAGGIGFRNGSQFTMFFTKNNNGTLTLAVEVKMSATDTAPTTKTLALSPQGLHKILSMWLGQPADSGLGDFQTALMK
jgi:hypothetical protein